MFFSANFRRVKNRSGPAILDIRGQTLRNYGKMIGEAAWT